MAIGKLENWNESVLIAINQYKNCLREYRLYRKRPSNRNHKKLQLEVETMALILIDDLTMLDADTKKPIQMIYRNSIENNTELLSVKLLFAAFFSCKEVISKLNIFKLDIANMSQSDLTKAYLDEDER